MSLSLLVSYWPRSSSALAAGNGQQDSIAAAIGEVSESVDQAGSR